MPFVKERLEQFAAIPFNEQAFPSAKIARAWALSMGITNEQLAQFGLSLDDLPTALMSRSDVRKLCRDSSKHVLVGYICAMAWGNQGGGKYQPQAKRAWSQGSAIEAVLQTLRMGNLSHQQEYQLFCGKGKVVGLGPSYFTKLIFFFSPHSDRYIMDQWTAKSINYLVGEVVVRITGTALSAENSGERYRNYCSRVDELTVVLVSIGQFNTGEQVELRLFSVGGRVGMVGAWRAIIKNVFPAVGKSSTDQVISSQGECAVACSPRGTKMARATEIFQNHPDAKHREMQRLFVEGAGLTLQGATTYFYIIKKRHEAVHGY